MRPEYLPWGRCFVDPDRPGEPASVRIQQVTRRQFLLESSLRYIGPTGVPGLPAEALTLRPTDLGSPPLTDLASVPSALRWFVSPYDVHTPAALIHDRLVGPTALPGVSETDANRLFRFMLKELGVRFLRRWMMWTAVTFGTRWRSGGRHRALLMLWSLLAAVGMTGFVVAALQGWWWLLLIAAVAPAPASLLWGKQYGAGLVAAATAIWVLPPTLLGYVGYCIYAELETLIGWLPFTRRFRGDEPLDYRNF